MGDPAWNEVIIAGTETGDNPKRTLKQVRRRMMKRYIGRHSWRALDCVQMAVERKRREPVVSGRARAGWDEWGQARAEWGQQAAGGRNGWPLGLAMEAPRGCGR